MVEPNIVIMSKERKKFKDTKAGMLLNGLKNPILDVIGSSIPGALIITNLIKSVTNDPSIPEDKRTAVLDALNEELEVIKLENEDRDSARSREVNLQKAGGSNWLMYLSGVFALGLMGFIAYVIVYQTIPDDNAPLFHQLMGLIEGVVLSIFTFYFGSSQGSKMKDKRN